MFGADQAFGADPTGRIVFPASISGGTGYALFMSDEEGHAAPIFRTGMSISTAPGQTDTLTIFAIALSSGCGPSGRPTIQSDSGQVVVHARLTSMFYPSRQALAVIQLPPNCYANCDLSMPSPLLTANDFQCFLNKFAANDPWANCDNSTAVPALTANDFQCFLNRFAAGCS